MDSSDNDSEDEYRIQKMLKEEGNNINRKNKIGAETKHRCINWRDRLDAYLSNNIQDFNIFFMWLVD